MRYLQVYVIQVAQKANLPDHADQYNSKEPVLNQKLRCNIKLGFNVVSPMPQTALFSAFSREGKMFNSILLTRT